jgi:hypothetical protein
VKIEQLLWYARRARTMEQGELRTRFAGALEDATEYVRWRLGRANRRMHDLDFRRFRFCRSAEPLLPELAWNFHPTETELDALISGVHHALGFPWAWESGRSAWHRAPDTGRLWPKKFSRRIDYRPGNATGDARVMWEPNRLQQLVSLALATRFAPARAEPAARMLQRQLLSWREANPLHSGVNYTSAMECALRILSVCFASDLARPYLGDDDYWHAVAALVLEHAEFTNARLSLYSSLGNHTIAECTGLFVAALLFPEATAAAKWEARAWKILKQAARRVVMADGGSAEQALHYHAQVLDHLEIAVRVGEHFGRDMASLDALRHAGGRFLAQFRCDRVHLPCIGDDDEGQALSRHFASSWAQATEPRAATNAAIAACTGGGYSIVRSAGDCAEIVFDHGPLGMAPNFGHGHADALSLQLRIRGAPVLIDPGTFCYGGEARWRSHFRSTAAHNTVTVDGRSQAKEAGPFLWATSYSCELLYMAIEPERTAILVARHDGYAQFGVRHTRAVKIVPGFIFVLDRLEGAGAHELCLRWNFAGILRGADGAHLLDGPAALRCIAAGGEARLFVGSEAPPAGWRSERYGVKQPVSTLELRCFVKLPHQLATGFVLPSGNGGGDLVLQTRALGQLLDALGTEPGGIATASPLKRAAAARLHP